MAVVIEGTTVVIASAALDHRFPGGIAAFAQQPPNGTYHSDGTLAAVSFMVLADAKQFVGELVKHGLSDPWGGRSNDIAVVVENQGFLTPCDWLKVDLLPVTNDDRTTSRVTAAWAIDETPASISCPDGWQPGRMEQVSVEDLKRDYEFVQVREDESGASVTSYRHRLTGQTLYIARTTRAGSPELRQRYVALREELDRLLATPDLPQRTRAAAQLHQQVTDLAAQCEPALELYFLQGIAARLADDWSKAETAFRRVTEQWPGNRDAWLELTWALASLGRAAEAEAAARRAIEVDGASAAAHANLASTLLQQDRPDEALLAIERAIELDPSERMNRSIHAAVRQALGERSPQRQAGVPWYRRWLR